MPPHKRVLRRAEGPRPDRPDPAKDRAGHRRLLLGHKAQVDLRQRARRACACRARRPAVRHGGDVAHLEADLRQDPRDRLLQRQPDDDVQHPHAGLGRRDTENSRYTALYAAASRAQQRVLRVRRPDALRRRDQDRGGGGRPAGRAVRPDLLYQGRGQEYLRHGRLSADEHRREAGILPKRAGHHCGVGAGRKSELRAGRFDFCGGRSYPVAAGRAASAGGRPRQRVHGAEGQGHERLLRRACVHRSGCAALGPVRPRHHRGPDPRREQEPHHPRDAGQSVLPDQRCAGRHAGGFRH